MASNINGLEKLRILLVEDDYLIALAAVDFLEEAGAEVIGPVGTIQEALQYINQSSVNIDAAVLDVNLHGKKSYAVADALAAHAIKFIFATGYDVSVMESRYQAFHCQKPFSGPTLIKTLNEICIERCRWRDRRTVD